MTFTNPAILVGLVALAIPLAIHLLGRRRARRVLLPTMRFAEGAHAETRGRMWLRRLALLAARLAAVALVVVAIAGPRFGSAAGPAGQPGPWIVCLDRSLSMVAVEDGESRVVRAADAVQALLAEADPDSPAVLARWQDDPPDGPAPRTVGQVRLALRGIRSCVTPWPPLMDLIRGAVADACSRNPRWTLTAESQSPPRPSLPAGARLVVATDAAPWTLRGLKPGAFNDLGCEVILVPVGGAVENAWLGLPQTEVVQQDGARSLSVRVEVASRSTARGETVRLTLEGGGRPIETQTPAGRSTARFLVPLAGDGPWQGQVEIAEVYPPGRADALADNVRYFTALVPKPTRVLVVDAAAEKESPVAAAFFVAAAFPKGADGAPPATLTDAAKADAGALKQADAVFWVGSKAAPDPEALERFVADGGGLLWVPAEAKGPDAPMAALLGAAFGPAEDVPAGVTIDPGGYESRLLAAFEGGTGADVSRPVFRRRLALEARGGTAAIRFMDGRPAILARQVGAGRAIALAAGPGRDWGDLATRPEFVVLVHSLVESFSAAERDRNLVHGNIPASSLIAENSLLFPGNWRLGEFPDVPSLPERDRVLYSVNEDPDKTADLVPHVDRLTAAFRADRVQVFDPSQLPARKAVTGRDAGDAAVWVVLVLAAALAAEALLAGRQSAAPTVFARAERG